MSIYDTHKPAAGEGGLYLKLKDGESIKVRIVSEPAIMEAESEDRETGETRLTTRYGWLLWNEEAKQVHVWSQGVRFFRSIAALAQDEEWGDPQKYDIKITRSGSDTNTTYNVTPSANREPLSAEAKDKIKEVDLIEKLKASPFNQRVMWLSDFEQEAEKPSPTAADKSPKAETPAQETAKEATASSPAQEEKEVVIEDIGDEPINLDDIPF